MDNQEWLSGNREISFPFSELTLGSAAPPPKGLFLDMRVFIADCLEIQVYLSSLSLENGDYTLVFNSCASGNVLFSGSIPQLNGNASRAFLKQAIFDAESVVLFTPGPDWDKGFTGNWTAASGLVEPTLVNPGPRPFQGFQINGKGPAVFNLDGGCNFGFTQGKSLTPAVSPTGAANAPAYWEFSAGGGLGAGYCPNPANAGYILSLGGALPDARGNVNLSANDCLRVGQMSLNGAPIPARLQVSSDCTPCCDCSNYRAMSRAIERLGAKIADAADKLCTALDGSSENYNSALKNAAPVSMAGTRAIALNGVTDQVSLVVQNFSSVPVCVYVAVSAAGISTIASETAGIVALSGSVAASVAALAPMAAVPGQSASAATQPPAGFGNGTLFQVLASGSSPLPVGGFVAGVLQLTNLTADLSESPVLTFQTIAVYGSIPNISVMDTYCVQAVNTAASGSPVYALTPVATPA